MVRVNLDIKTCCLYVIRKKKIKFEQKFFASPKICTPVHLWLQHKLSLVDVLQKQKETSTKQQSKFLSFEYASDVTVVAHDVKPLSFDGFRSWRPTLKKR